MKFSTRAEYGLRAMINLASAYPQTKTIREISKEDDISFKYLERLMSELRKNNLVKAYKGAQGGYLLGKKPAEVMVGEIVEVLEGSLAPMRCAEGCCVDVKKCPSSYVWIKLGKEIRKTLYDISLKDLINKK